jgi:S-formylglutathione hydrolase FrmB
MASKHPDAYSQVSAFSQCLSVSVQVSIRLLVGGMSRILAGARATLSDRSAGDVMTADLLTWTGEVARPSRDRKWRSAFAVNSLKAEHQRAA